MANRKNFGIAKPAKSIRRLPASGKSTICTYDRTELAAPDNRCWTAECTFVTGDKDTFYLDGAVRLLDQSLKQLGSDAEVILLLGRGHVDYLTPEFYTGVRGQMTDLFRRLNPATTINQSRERRMVRKPAIKFPQLRKKLEKARQRDDAETKEIRNPSLEGEVRRG